MLCGVGPVLDVTGQQGPLSSILAAACSITVPSPDNSQHYTTKTAQYVAFKLMILAIASRPSVSLPLCRTPFAGKFDFCAINSGQYIGHLLVAASFASCPTATFSRCSDGRLLAQPSGGINLSEAADRNGRFKYYNGTLSNSLPREIRTPITWANSGLNSATRTK